MAEEGGEWVCRSLLVRDQVRCRRPPSFRVHRQSQTLKGVGPQQRMGLVLSEDHDGYGALAVYGCPHLSVPRLDTRVSTVAS